MFLHYHYFVWPRKGRIKVDFNIQFPFPCYVSKVTLQTFFKGGAWEVGGVTSVYMGAFPPHETTWWSSLWRWRLRAMLCSGGGSLLWESFQMSWLGYYEKSTAKACLYLLWCWGELLPLGWAEPSPRCYTAVNPGRAERARTWSQRQFITGLEMEFQCFNHKASPPTCLPLFLKSK